MAVNPPVATTKPFSISLKHFDVAILSAPAIVTALFGIGCGWAEGRKNTVAKTIGCIGNRTATLLVPALGAPVAFYSFCKMMFAKMLNGVTLGKINVLRNFSKFSTRQFGYVSTTINGVATLMPHTNVIIKSGKKVIDTFHQFADALPRNANGRRALPINPRVLQG